MLSLLLRETQAPTGDLCPAGLAPPFRQTATSSPRPCRVSSVFFPVRNDCCGTFLQEGLTGCSQITGLVFHLVRKEKVGCLIGHVNVLIRPVPAAPASPMQASWVPHPWRARGVQSRGAFQCGRQEPAVEENTPVPAGTVESAAATPRSRRGRRAVGEHERVGARLAR